MDIKTLKKAGLKALDIIEVAMPVMALLVIFVSFILNAFARYVLRHPINACYELCLAGLVWCLLLSAPYAVRKKTNVMFTLVYDKMNAAGQMAFRLLGNGFLIFCFAVMLFPSYDWVRFMKIKYTAVLHIRMDIVYAPYVVFNVLTLAHLIYDFVVDIRTLVRAIRGEEPLRKEVTMDKSAAEGGDKK